MHTFVCACRQLIPEPPDLVPARDGFPLLEDVFLWYLASDGGVWMGLGFGIVVVFLLRP